MIYRDFYGRPTEVGSTGVPHARVLPATAPRNSVHAQVVALREYRINAKPVVTDANGIANRMLAIELAHANPAVVEGERARDVGPNPGPYRRAETISLHEAEQGIQLGGGSKIGPDGPVDAFWVVGKYGDLPIYSDVLLTGLFSSDITVGGEWRLVYVP